MTDTLHLGLPVLEAAQAQKHVTHNEALTILDALVMLAVLDRDLSTSPVSPAAGDRYLVKSPGTGAFTGKSNQIAQYADGAWFFYPPRTGWTCYVQDEGVLLAWDGTAWQPALQIFGGGAAQNLSLLGLGTTADGTNPFSAKLNNALWTAKTVAEGGDGNLRYKLSKESAAKTLSFLLQDNYSGRAEIGLTGDDDFHFKVSADGTTWLEAIAIDRSTGKLTVGQGFSSPAAARAQVAAAALDALAFNGMQINGAMEVSQENGTAGVTLTATSSPQTKYLVDQVSAAYRGTFVATAQQVADAPAGYGTSLKFTVATAQSSLGTNDELSIVSALEGFRVSRLAFGASGAAAVSFAFWAKAHPPGTYSGSLRNGGKTRSYPFTFTVSAADTWEYKTVTVAAGDTSGTWSKDANVGLYLTICIAGGSSRIGAANAWAAADSSGATGTTNGVAATSDVFQLAGVIVLPGLELPSADRAPLIMRPFDQERLLCMRYWAAVYVDAQFAAQNASENFAQTARFPVPMRAVPTLSITAGFRGNLLAGFPVADQARLQSCRFAIASNAAGNTYAIGDIVTADARL